MVSVGRANGAGRKWIVSDSSVSHFVELFTFVSFVRFSRGPEQFYDFKSESASVKSSLKQFLLNARSYVRILLLNGRPINCWEFFRVGGCWISSCYSSMYLLSGSFRIRLIFFSCLANFTRKHNPKLKGKKSNLLFFYQTLAKFPNFLRKWAETTDNPTKTADRSNLGLHYPNYLVSCSIFQIVCAKPCVLNFKAWSPGYGVLTWKVLMLCLLETSSYAGHSEWRTCEYKQDISNVWALGAWFGQANSNGVSGVICT